MQPDRASPGLMTAIAALRGVIRPGPGDIALDAVSVIAPARVVIAAAALAIVWIDPTEPAANAAETYAVLIAYGLYSLVLLLAAPGIRAARTGLMIEYADLVWTTALVGLSGGTSSVFFLLYLFSILNAAFQRGYAASLQTAGLATLLFWGAGYLARPLAGFDVNVLVLRGVFLLAVGHLAGHWGAAGIRQRRRLRLLKEASEISNPRFGVDAALGRTLELIRRHFDAETCLLVTADEAGDYVARRAVAGAENTSMNRVTMPADVGAMLTALPGSAVAVHCLPAAFGHGASFAWDASSGAPQAIEPELLGRLLALLDGRSLISVPVKLGPQATGRVHVASRRPAAYTRSQAEFLLQVVDALALALENIRLVDHLATDAAEQERNRIARDLHDSVIQPYIGLELGLTALRSELPPEHASQATVDQLLQLTRSEIEGLRGFVRHLKGARQSEDSLIASIRRFADRFSQATGIRLRCELPSQARLPDRLAGEVFQMVTEALSNVRRHTGSPEARIDLVCDDTLLTLRVANSVRRTAAPFTPGSIAERAAALGGRAEVTVGSKETAVTVHVPL